MKNVAHEKHKNVYKILVREPETKILLEIPMRRLEDNIKINVNEVRKC